MEKIAEFLSSDLGVTLAVRPCLPFDAESYRLTSAGKVEVSGLNQQGKKMRITFEASEESLAEIRSVGDLLLVEYAASGSDPEREVILQPEV